MKGFKDFLMRGNLIDLAVAFILGAAFGKVVESFTKIILDIIGLFGGTPDFSAVTVGPINIGVFLTALVAFVIMSAVIYFGVVKPYEAVKDLAKTEEEKAKEEEEEAKPATDELLMEIRDLLKERPNI